MEEREFLTRVAITGLAEVEMSALAIAKATSTKLKELAQRIVLDHCRANIELIELARRKGVDLPEIPDTEHRILMSRLRLVTDEFDYQFIRAVTDNLQRDMSACLEECEKGEDLEIKAFALKWLQRLESRNLIAERLAA